ncbi:MAG: hypothetical protein ABUS57_22150, partial [Pseudomonadota bacterium]
GGALGGDANQRGCGQTYAFQPLYERAGAANIMAADNKAHKDLDGRLLSLLLSTNANGVAHRVR